MDQNEGARLVPATRSGHLIPMTEPDLIVAQVLEILTSQ